MRAKKSPGMQSETAGDYECIWCETIFVRKEEDAKVCCPECGNSNVKDMVPVYVDDDGVDALMYTDKEFAAGD